MRTPAAMSWSSEMIIDAMANMHAIKNDAVANILSYWFVILEALKNAPPLLQEGRGTNINTNPSY